MFSKDLDQFDQRECSAEVVYSRSDQDSVFADNWNMMGGKRRAVKWEKSERIKEDKCRFTLTKPSGNYWKSEKMKKVNSGKFAFVSVEFKWSKGFLFSVW